MHPTPPMERSIRKTGRRHSALSIRAAAVACLLLIGLSGCLLNRVVEVKEQFCDFESNFTLQYGEETEIIFHNPVLRDTDILWLSGTEPTAVAEWGDTRVLTYVIEKVSKTPQPEYDSAIDLHFERSDEHFTLSRIQMDSILSSLMDSEIRNPELIDRMAMNFCQAGLSLGVRDVTHELSDEQIALLPSRTEILEILGEPSEYLEPESAYVYEFQPKNDEPEPKTARVTLWFDESGELPVKMESSYSRYTTRADFVARQMVFSVAL